MTKEEKQLLLIDLCARLPYGVKVCARFNTGNRYTTNVTAICADRDYIQIRQNVLHPYTNSSVEDIRPYLRSMSSVSKMWGGLTKEEIENPWSLFDSPLDALDYFLENHIDFRGLIPMGLALEAPEGMY